MTNGIVTQICKKIKIPKKKISLAEYGWNLWWERVLCILQKQVQSKQRVLIA